MRIFVFVTIFALANAAAFAADKNPLSHLAEKVITTGKDASLNAFFAAQLGLPATKPVPLKRLTIESAAATNIINVSLTDRRSIILSVREKNLTTFYLTDPSGKLRKAIVNDSSVRDGGLTNLPIARVEKDFSSQKDFWLKRYPVKE